MEIRETLDNTFFLSVFNSENIPGERKDGNIMLAFIQQPDQNVSAQQE